jgi:hypothetical protein
MKRFIYLFLVLPLFFLSCQSTPEAYFYVDNAKPEVGQEVFFTNDSHKAKRFEWDFGDGYVSNDENPSHIYTGTGTFEVTLTAISRSDQTDKAALTIEVLIPTLLEIQVLEWDTEIPVKDASVRLYPTIIDWEDETNIESEGFTDAKGNVVFSNLGPYVFYVDVWEQNHDNYTLKSEDIGWIRTPEVIPHQINRFYAYVDIVNHSKGLEKGGRKVIIKNSDRKFTDKKQPVSDSGSQDWKELFSRSTVKK